MKSLVPSGCFKFSLHNPCKKMVQCFKFKARKPVFLGRLHFRLPKPKRSKSRMKPATKRSVAKLLSALLSSLRQPQKESDQITALTSFPETVHPKAPFPSPMTPAYVKANAAAAATKEASYLYEVEDACRSFENYLVGMIVEDGKVKDLTNVEELLYCWKNLRCPVFTDLVCRFYGELCKDLFSSSSEDGSDSSIATK